MNYPKDCQARKIGSKARQLLHFKVDTEHFEYRESTGVDEGCDCIIEYVENNHFKNNLIFGQIKGTTSITILKDSKTISFPLELKTIYYALNCNNAFLLFLADVTNQIVFYLPLQDYFSTIDLTQLRETQKTLNVHIPIENNFEKKQDILRSLSKNVYKNGKLV